MVAWSALGRSFGINIFKNHVKSPKTIQNALFSTTKQTLGGHGHETMALQPSRWQYHKFKDMFHLYVMVGLIPVTIIIFYANVFIGPATLTRLTPGQNPKHWEYHRHPITRFIARYIHNNPQQDYEKFLHWLDEEQQKRKLVILEKEVIAKMAENHDYKAYYYRPLLNKYIRNERKISEEMMDRIGSDYSE